MTDDIYKLSKKAAEIILSFPKSTMIRIISHYDADGISSAAIISNAVLRAGYNIHTTLMRNPFDKGLERISKEDNNLIIFSDMGSGQIETIEKMNCKSIIIDHHRFIKEKNSDDVLQINANLCGINGNYEACGSSLSYLVAKEIDPRNIDLSPLAVTGIIGDKQYIGNIRGYNKKVVEDALTNNLLIENTEIKLYGKTLFDALYYSIDPYYNRISGNEEGIKQLFSKLKLKKETKIEELSISQSLFLC
jgi:RecJ-like exonuclease